MAAVRAPGPTGIACWGSISRQSDEFEREIVNGCEGIKPGWVRVNFNYFISEAVFEFIIDAVDLVANEGWKLLPYYDFDPASGEWRHRDGRPEAKMRLHDLKYSEGQLQYRARHASEPEWVLQTYIEDAKKIFAAAGERIEKERVRDPVLTEDFQHLRWFPLSQEILAELDGPACEASDPPAFTRR